MDYRVEEVSQFKGETLRIDFDCREPIFINSSVAGSLGIRAGKLMSEEDVEDAVRYLLDERDYGYVEMFKKLENNYPEEICYGVVNDLARLGLIDDRRYAAKCAEYFLTRKLWGKYRAREEMRRRGIPAELIDEALEEYDDGSQDRLRELVEKKYARKLSEENGVNKVKAALARQGFSYDEIKHVLAEYEEE